MSYMNGSEAYLAFADFLSSAFLGRMAERATLVHMVGGRTYSERQFTVGGLTQAYLCRRSRVSSEQRL